MTNASSGATDRLTDRCGIRMRKLIVSTFLTLDGVMQAPGGPGEDDSGGFALGGWSVNHWDEVMGQVMDEATSTPFAMVLGRKTYDIMAAIRLKPQKKTAPSRSTTPPSTSRLGATLRWSGADRSSSRETRPKASRFSRRMTARSCKYMAAGT